MDKQTWEYMRKYEGAYEPMNTDKLNGYGSEGWELVNFITNGVDGTYIFKRPVTNDQAN